MSRPEHIKARGRTREADVRQGRRPGRSDRSPS
jgi:hypothetical protein